MITPPLGWMIERTEDGLLLCPPEGAARALLRYAERRRPVRRAIELVRDARVPEGFVERAISAPRRLETIEGEHAALVTRSGMLGGAEVELVYGYVFLDDYYAVLEGIVAPAMVETVERMLVGDVHLLGRPRRRRFVYAPPPGWQGTGTLFEARWYPLGYPRDPARIFVNAALPSTPGLARAILDKLGVTQAGETFVTRHGLEAQQYAVRVADSEMHVFLLTDAEFLYSVRADAALEVARVLVDSIEPVPQPRRPVVESLQFWAD